MGTLASMYIKKDVLKTLLETVEKKQEKGIELTISISDDTNNYGQNLSSFVSQSKEDREQKKQRFFTGNGKVFWTNGTIVTAEKTKRTESVAQNEKTPQKDEDLPF